MNMQENYRLIEALESAGWSRVGTRSTSPPKRNNLYQKPGIFPGFLFRQPDIQPSRGKKSGVSPALSACSAPG